MKQQFLKILVLNTAKTMVGYFGSLVRKYSPLGKRFVQLEDIYNYLAISDKVSTSGQPTEDEFKLFIESLDFLFPYDKTFIFLCKIHGKNHFLVLFLYHCVSFR